MIQDLFFGSNSQYSSYYLQTPRETYIFTGNTANISQKTYEGRLLFSIMDFIIHSGLYFPSVSVFSGEEKRLCSMIYSELSVAQFEALLDVGDLFLFPYKNMAILSGN